MRKILFTAIAFIIGSFLIGCDPAANTASNTGNKPANSAAAAPAVDTAAIETELKKLANDMSAAQVKNDAAALDKLWADNYQFVAQDGSIATKAQRLDAMKSGATKIESLAYDEMTVRSNTEGTGAILIGRATVKGANLGKAVNGQFRMTQVWSKTKDGWRLASGQVTEITAADGPGK